MNERIPHLSMTARKAVQAKDWRTVSRLARDIIKLDSRQAEGHFLLGLAQKAARESDSAITSFERSLRLDDGRYDAATELAELLASRARNGEAFSLLQKHEQSMSQSPLYLDRAALVYIRISKWQEAWHLLQQADRLQPGIERIMANMADCAVSLGKIEEAQSIYKTLLARRPGHQQNHFQLARLNTATDDRHIKEMEAVVAGNGLPPQRNIFLYYAIGKELEDLGRWDEAFDYYKRGGDAAAEASKGKYAFAQDLQLIDAIIDTCSADWLASKASAASIAPRPIFVVGLPRTGTTLVERILSSHSGVESAGETLTIERLLRGRGSWAGDIRPEHIRRAAASDMARLATEYVQSLHYLLSGAPRFVEKYTYNFFYLGMIAAAFPNASIVHLRRHPMDACFAMYKQPYFRFAFRLDDLGPFYLAYRKLMNHWRQLLGERLIEVDYESMVSDQQAETHNLLSSVGLDFEPQTLSFENNVSPTSTASSVQVREKIHSRSVGRWRHFRVQLAPLEDYLRENGVSIPDN